MFCAENIIAQIQHNKKKTDFTRFISLVMRTRISVAWGSGRGWGKAINQLEAGAAQPLAA
ncbi:MAG: hypothetical protein AAFQ45_01345 [Pseudomonadota bacterium]